MAFSAASGFGSSVVPIRFHQIRHGEDLDGVAKRYQMTREMIAQQNPGAERPGDMLVINLEYSSAAQS
jgi:hypothetical protein